MADGKALFITLEGGEGAGKSTQIKRVAAALEQMGKQVVVTREPGGSKAAEAMRNLFIAENGAEWPLATQALLMFTARSHHTETLIKPALAEGKVVICDRYTDSTRVYQGYAGGMGLKAIDDIKELAIGDFEPDLTFILDIDPEIGLKRGAGRGNDTDTTFEQKDIEFHKALREGFLEIAEGNAVRCKVIDATQDEDSVAAAILAEVEKRIAA